jgi:hypothetical protein
VAYLLKEGTVKPEKELLLGNGCVTRNSGGNVLFVPLLYIEDQLPLRESKI